MNRGIYQHFSIEDRPFLDKGMEWIKKVEDSYAPFLTPFINPHQEKLLKILAKTYGLSCSSSGEFVLSEYVRILLYPDYFQPEFSDFEISLQEIVYSNKFEHLTHAKILGTVINQLGIERKLFGDILVDDERAQIMINQQFLLLFQDGLKKIGRIPVSLEERPFTDKIDKLEQYREMDLCVSSFRLDVLLSNVFPSYTMVFYTSMYSYTIFSYIWFNIFIWSIITNILIKISKIWISRISSNTTPNLSRTF